MAHEIGSHTDIPSPSIRASDADRLTTVQALQDAMARGLLNPNEASERMAAAFAAVHLRDLDPLTADLPKALPSIAAPPGWAALATLAVDQLRNSFSDSATGRVRPARVAAVLLLVVLVLAVGVLTAELFANIWDTAGHRGFGRH